MATIKKNGNFMSLPKGYSRTNPIPLDITDVWYSYEELSNYAKNSPVAYVGQIVGLVDENAETAKAYVIINTKGDLLEIGSKAAEVNPTVDGLSITFVNNKLQLKDYGKYYYKYINGAYIKQIVNEEFPWKAGLEPKVVLDNGELILGWYEPNPTTLEGVNSQIANLTAQVENNKLEITSVKSSVSDLTNTLNNYVKKLEYQEKINSIESQLSDLSKRMTWVDIKI